MIKTKPCKKITTFDYNKKPKGWLLEIVSELDNFTTHLRGQIYLSVLMPGKSMDYHLHAQSDYFVTCIKGRVKEIIYKNKNKKEIIKMGDGDFKTVFLPKGYPHAIENMGRDEAYVLIYRYPAWNPKIKEQLDIRRKDINTDKAWKNIRKFIKDFKKS